MVLLGAIKRLIAQAEHHADQGDAGKDGRGGGEGAGQVAPAGGDGQSEKRDDGGQVCGGNDGADQKGNEQNNDDRHLDNSPKQMGRPDAAPRGGRDQGKEARPP
ncbi:hypothetical protein ABMK85_01185 [Paracoccus denitrificans]